MATATAIENTGTLERVSPRSLTRSRTLFCPKCGSPPRTDERAEPIETAGGANGPLLYLRFRCSGKGCPEFLDLRPTELKKLHRLRQTGKLGFSLEGLDMAEDTLRAIVAQSPDDQARISASRGLVSIAVERSKLADLSEKDASEMPLEHLYGGLTMTKGGPIDDELTALAEAVLAKKRGAPPLPVQDAEFTVVDPVAPAEPEDWSNPWQ